MMKAPPNRDQTPLEPEEMQLCTSCTAPNAPAAHFCVKCGAPLSSYAATGPFESLFAEDHVYRQAAEHPHNLIVVLGIWVIFGMMALAGSVILQLSRDIGFSIETVFAAFLLAISVMILWKTTRNYRAGKREPHEST
ncbi:MAG: hypothetical protein NT154_31065 [Verrucomicrobia bacterium]|nr:hypothetical protein [Verrucomicrobiota bacterium]